MEEKEILDDEVSRIVNKGEITREELIKCTRISAIRSGLSFSIIGVIIAIIGIALLITTFTDSFDASFLPYILIPCGIIIAVLPFVLGVFADKFLDNLYNNSEWGYGFSIDRETYGVYKKYRYAYVEFERICNFSHY